MPFPQREYYRVDALKKRWGVEEDDIRYALETGQLRACIWLQEMVVEKVRHNGEFRIICGQERITGLVVVQENDCRRIFSNKQARIRCFRSLQDHHTCLRLSPEESEQTAMVASMDQLVILYKDCVDFEDSYALSKHMPPSEKKPKKNDVSFKHNNHYRAVSLRGEEFKLGPIQASIVKELHTASMTDNPWVYGKSLLHESGSSAYHMRDVFKSQKRWRKLILSDGRGYYRLNC